MPHKMGFKYLLNMLCYAKIILQFCYVAVFSGLRFFAAPCIDEFNFVL